MTAPDPARDARIAARRAEDRRKAGAALDDLLASRPVREATGCAYRRGWDDGFDAGLRHSREALLVDDGSKPTGPGGQLQHNRAYGVPTDSELDLRTCCSTLKTHEHGEWCRNRTITPHYGVTPCALAGDGEHDCADPTREASCRPARDYPRRTDRDDAGHRMPCGRIECQIGDGAP